MQEVKEVQKRWAELVTNPVSVLDYVYISDPLKGVVKFLLWAHLIECFNVFLTHSLIIVLKARQIGLSWLLAVYAVWIILTKPESNVLLISKGEREAFELLNKCKFILNHFPDELFPSKPTFSLNSASTLGIQAMNSKITALPCTATTGVGEAATLVICDEWDKWEPFLQEQTFASLKPTIDAGGQFIAVSTVNKLEPDSFFKSVFRKALEGINNFKWLFYPYSVRPSRDDDWYERQKREYPDYQLEQEYPRSIEEALSPLSAKSVFDKDALTRLLANVGEPIETRRGYVHIYKYPEVGVTYVAGADTGEGVGLDYSTLTILGTSAVGAEVVAVIHSNNIKPDIFAYEVYKLCEEYFWPLLAVENNGLGIATINKLLELNHHNLYYGDTNKEKAGITTTASSKQYSLIDLDTALKSGGLISRFKPQVLELFNFHWHEGRDGSYKPQAASGCHDDLVDSLRFANDMRKFKAIRRDIRVTYPQGRWN